MRRLCSLAASNWEWQGRERGRGGVGFFYLAWRQPSARHSDLEHVSSIGEAAIEYSAIKSPFNASLRAKNSNDLLDTNNNNRRSGHALLCPLNRKLEHSCADPTLAPHTQTHTQTGTTVAQCAFWNAFFIWAHHSYALLPRSLSCAHCLTHSHSLFLSTQMSYLYSTFAQLVSVHCKSTVGGGLPVNQCKHNLLGYGYEKLQTFSDAQLEALDPYQRDANELSK